MKAFTSTVISSSHMILPLFWLFAAAAKIADHDNFVRQLSSLLDNENAATAVSILVPLFYVIFSVLFIPINMRRKALYISSAALVILSGIFLYMDVYRPMGVCACLAFSDGVLWKGSWIITLSMLSINLIAIILARRLDARSYNVQ